MNKELLQQKIDEKLVSVQKHPEAELYIYNYSPKVQYERLWDEITLQTRGLIMDSDMNIVARPMCKFFNLEEHKPEEMPNEPFEVSEKLDGSLGILYFLNGNPYIATRGSFTSDQAIHANEVLYRKYKHVFAKLNPLLTYLFLITAIHTETGIETLPDIGFPIVKRFDGIKDINELRGREEDNKEGFVIRFQNGFRVKMKFAEYVRLHRIVTGVSNIAVWEYLKEGRSFDELLEKVPDEFFKWLQQTRSSIQSNFDEIRERALAAYAKCHSLESPTPDKKTFALAVMKDYREISSILFNIYNNKDYHKIIWKMIRPDFAKPFKTEINA